MSSTLRKSSKPYPYSLTLTLTPTRLPLPLPSLAYSYRLLFFSRMERQRTKDGIHDTTSGSGRKYTEDELALMRTQDVNYLNLKATSERRKGERLAASLHAIGGVTTQRSRSKPKHTVFVENSEQAATFDAAKHFETPRELLSRAFNRVKVGLGE
jgi:U3 small nucleolar RNA-associated protein 11